MEKHTCWEEPIRTPIFLQENLNHFVLHDEFQLPLRARGASQLWQTSKIPENSGVGHDVDFLTNTMMRTPAVVDIAFRRTIRIDLVRIGEGVGVEIRINLCKRIIEIVPN